MKHLSARDLVQMTWWEKVVTTAFILAGLMVACTMLWPHVPEQLKTFQFGFVCLLILAVVLLVLLVAAWAEISDLRKELKELKREL